MRERELLSVVALLEDSKDHKLSVARSVRLSTACPRCVEVSSAMTRAGLTPHWRCVMTNCFRFITSRAIRRLDQFGPHIS